MRRRFSIFTLVLPRRTFNTGKDMSFDVAQASYVALRSVVTERTSRVVVWCGAGLSVSAGLPTWSQLRQRLHSTLVDKAANSDTAERERYLTSLKKIEKFHNQWVAFQLLQKELGQTSYRAVIREALSKAATAPTPEAYKSLWRLPVTGVLNLNLDRLATRAYAEIFPGKSLIEFNSLSVGAYTHVLKSPERFVYNLHGVTDDANSWVFTQEDLSRLLDQPGYTNFVRSVLSTSTVIFLGISADDIAVGGHLDRLAGAGIDTGAHFWVTDRRDHQTDQWAEASHIRVIKYANVSGDHTELGQFFRDLLSFIPPDDVEIARPVVLSTTLPDASLPDSSELARRDAEEIRFVLNSHAAEMFERETPDTYDSYAKFCEEYDEAIHRAWYTSTLPGRNLLLGYQLIGEIAQGAFGRVYRANDPSGNTVAIKILRNDIRLNQNRLQSFRRGVRSMRILSERGVTGMVAYREASEIPAFVVMDFVEGGNLKDAVLGKQLNDWYSILRAATELTDIIRAAHALPERVLHRDLRPANIMLENLWSGDEWNVVVLDFDLSWHRGAFEETMLDGAGGITGYLAPEQIERIKGVSTRHASVDSFGLGMCFYFMLSGRDPVADQHRHRTWLNTLQSSAKERECSIWRSLSARFARLILNATRDRQADRWDINQILGELQRLKEALTRPNSVDAADLWAEELAARSDIFTDYIWDLNKLTASKALPTGVNVQLRGNESTRAVDLEVTWATTGVEDWKRIGKWIPQAKESCVSVLKSVGWTVTTAEADRTTMAVTAAAPVEAVRRAVDNYAGSIDRATRVLSFT
jgi:eukaryotic-like serine/threonine-protein kinase